MYIGMAIIGLILILIAQNANTIVSRYKSETSGVGLEFIYGIIHLVGVTMLVVGGINCVSGNWR